ncbi:MAG: cell surface protein, partial [Halothiobacillaceae bacterium]
MGRCTLSTIICTAIGLSLFTSNPTTAASFTQDDWSTGPSATTATAPTHQNGWSAYSSAVPTTSVINSGADLTIGSVPDQRTHTQDSDFALPPSSAQLVRDTTSSDFTNGTSLTNITVSGGQLILTPTAYAPAWTANAALNPPRYNVSSVYVSAALADLDNDGDLDYLRGSYYGYIDAFENIGTASSPLWSAKAAWNTPYLGNYSAVAAGDIDGDGDYDLVVTNYSVVHVMRNIGSAVSPQWSEEIGWNFSASYNFLRPALADLDNDGDLDVMIGTSPGITYGYRNDGTSTAPSWVANPAWNVSFASYSAPTLADLDHDGDYDLLIGTSGGVVYAYENSGNATSPTWTAKSSWNTGSIGFGYVTPTFGDIDGDGDLDLIVGDRDGYSNVLLNTGTTYQSSGAFTSRVWNTGIHAGYNTFDYSGTTTANATLTLEFRAGDTATPDGSWSAWQTRPVNGDISTLLTNQQYFQYRATFSSSATTETPSINEITVNIKKYPFASNLALENNAISLGISLNLTNLGLYSSSYIYNLAAAGNYVYAAYDPGNSIDRLRIVDVTNPNAPLLTASTSHGTRV